MGKPHRSFTPEFKARVVIELLQGKKTLGKASRDYGIKDSVIARWRQEFLERAPQLFEQPDSKDAQEQRIAELEGVLGRVNNAVGNGKKSLGGFELPVQGRRI